MISRIFDNLFFFSIKLLYRLNYNSKVTFNNNTYLSNNKFKYGLINNELILYDLDKNSVIIKNVLNEILFEKTVECSSQLYVFSNKYLCVINSSGTEIYTKNNTYSLIHCCKFYGDPVEINNNIWVLPSRDKFIILDSSNDKLNVTCSLIDKHTFVSISHNEITNLKKKILEF